VAPFKNDLSGLFGKAPVRSHHWWICPAGFNWKGNYFKTLILDTGRDRQAGFFFLVVVGFYQCFYKSKVFCFVSDEIDTNTKLAGLVFSAINNLTVNLNLVSMHIEKH
jgi:hypothetical protein